ncbi:MAG: hypothetical protein ACJAYH_001108 [Celeribacter sp.]|jgi:hypothetical protein
MSFEASSTRGNHLRARRLVFITVPFCHGAKGSQNQVCVPLQPTGAAVIPHLKRGDYLRPSGKIVSFSTEGREPDFRYASDGATFVFYKPPLASRRLGIAL